MKRDSPYSLYFLHSPFSSFPIYMVSLLALIVLNGCATNKITNSGFLDDYSTLKPNGEEPMHSFVAPHFDRTSYTKFSIQSPVVAVSNERLANLTPDLKKELADYLVGEFEMQFAPLRRTNENNNVQGKMKEISIRSSITDFDSPNRLVNVAATVLLGPVTTGGATIEVEAIDVMQNERMLAMVCAEKANVLGWSGFVSSYSVLGHAKDAISDCVSRFIKLIEPKSVAATQK